MLPVYDNSCKAYFGNEHDQNANMCTAGIKHPVILGGMASATSVELVAAVSQAGGLGALVVSNLTAKQVCGQITAIIAATDKPFGINYLLFYINEADFETVLDAPPPVVSLAWAREDQDLLVYFQRVHDAGPLVMYMAGEVSEAIRAAEAGADVIVAQGTEGGGHVRPMSTMTLTLMVVDNVSPCPVISAGGIADGRGLAAALALGASGVLIGTRCYLPQLKL